MSATFKLEILEPGKADVFLATAGDDIPWTVVDKLDRAGIRVVGDLTDPPADEQRIRTLMRGCSGLVSARMETAVSAQDALPRLRVDLGAGTADVDGFRAFVLKDKDRIRAYAFLVGRLERDFRHAREAIRTAVEAEAGIPCLWADDGRHITNVESVRERTRLLIKHATFVIADLTLGVESPERENPSRAHEIGMAIAYERPVMLCSQEPRRYPYFSIGDMQMTFWLTEEDLEVGVREWVGVNRQSVARHIFNYRLPAPSIAKPVFVYDPKQRYIGPKTKTPSGMRRLLAPWA